MQRAIKILSYIGKAAGLFASVDMTPMNPKYGAVIFFAASLLKDTANRITEFLKARNP